MNFAACPLALAFTCVFGGATSAQEYSVIYNFSSGNEPFGRLYQDTTGALYGTTEYGGSSNAGTVYQLTEDHGRWTGRTIYEFAGSQDGANPEYGVTMDAAGNVYGTTFAGGTYGDGTIFSLSKSGNTWQETVLHSFGGSSDGEYGSTSLLYNTTTGVLYGATLRQGSEDCGTAYSLAPSNGSWTFTTIYNFRGGKDACGEYGTLHRGASTGTLIGTAGGGAYGQGAVFELRENGGNWTDKVLYPFTGGTDGGEPTDIDAGKQNEEDVLYGTTDLGGLYSYGFGVVFELNEKLKGHHESVLYTFGGGRDGGYPRGTKRDSTTGYLYGTTMSGGTYNYGVIFQLVPNGSSWSESVLYNFGSKSHDGLYPSDGPIQDPITGALYGTTENGGRNGHGTVWTYSLRSGR